MTIHSCQKTDRFLSHTVQSLVIRRRYIEHHTLMNSWYKTLQYITLFYIVVLVTKGDTIA